MKTTERLNKFLNDYQLLAGSRDGYPKIALTLNQVRELTEYIDGIWGVLIHVADMLDIDHDEAKSQLGSLKDIYLAAWQFKKHNVIQLINHASISLYDDDGNKTKYASLQDVFDILDEEL